MANRHKLFKSKQMSKPTEAWSYYAGS